MKPTNIFRWLHRNIIVGGTDGNRYQTFEKVLQQWWQAEDSDWEKGLVSEWRDVPVEEDK